jgi:hypothetical protein
MSEAPIEDFHVAAAGEDACAQVVPRNAEEAAEAVIEGAFSRDDADVVARRKLSGGLEADFIDDAGEEADATGQFTGAADGKAHGMGGMGKLGEGNTDGVRECVR